jgi:hypothetical protein
MKYVLLTAALLAAQISFAQSKPMASDTKAPSAAQIDLDRFAFDMCYLSNCNDVPAAPFSQARAQNRASLGSPQVHKFTEYTLPYPSGVSCTSLLGQADNLFQTILTTGTVAYSGRQQLDIQFNGEGRIQRANGNTATGVGAVGVRVVLTETPTAGAPIVTPLFERWVLHNALDFTLIDDLPSGATNPAGVNQPVINTVGVRRFYTLQPGSTYRVDVDVKWSDAFTGLTLEPSTISFVTGGGRGALMCVPVLQVAETNPSF